VLDATTVTLYDSFSWVEGGFRESRGGEGIVFQRTVTSYPVAVPVLTRKDVSAVLWRWTG
jgi:hypothetical protein